MVVDVVIVVVEAPSSLIPIDTKCNYESTKRHVEVSIGVGVHGNL